MSAEISRAIVLAAGLGKRMRPLTADRPKPLVEVAGRTLIDRVLDRLESAGVRDVVVNVHYRADQLETALAARTVPKITISDERDQLRDTGGGVAHALHNVPELKNAPFLVHNSDSIWTEGVRSNIARLIEHWDETRMDCLLLLALSTQSTGYDGSGDFEMHADGLLARRPEQSVAPFVFAGVSIAHPRLFDDAPDGAFSLNVLWDQAIDRGRLFGVRLEGQWMHVGSPAGLAQAEIVLKQSDADD